MSDTQEIPRTPAETLTELKSLLTRDLPEIFPFDGAVIHLSQISTDHSFIGRRTEHPLGRATGENHRFFANYKQRVFTFQQGDQKVEVIVSPLVSLLTDQEGRGGSGTYQRQDEYVMIKFEREGRSEHYTVNATENDLPQEVEALLFRMLEAAKTYNPNAGGLNIAEVGYGKKVKDVLEG